MNRDVPTEEPKEPGEPSTKPTVEMIPYLRRAWRILERRYALTATSYKHLSIGICVGRTSSVELILGDTRGTELIIPMSTWWELIRQRDTIKKHLDSYVSAPLWIGKLRVMSSYMDDIKLAELSINNTTISMKMETLDTLFTHDLCIKYMYSYLTQNLPLVDQRFSCFVSILNSMDRQNLSFSDISDRLRQSPEFDNNSIIDCELVTCALWDIVSYV